MDIIYEIIGKFLALVCVALLAYLTPKIKEWLEARTGKDHYEQLMQLIRAFARAAEQMFHDLDEDGSCRKNFVKDQLADLGVEITESVLNMIEGAVWEINTANRKAQVQDKALAAGGDGNG